MKKYDLIVTIVNKGYAVDVVNATKKAGAKGGTIINGRGSGIHDTVMLFGIPIEPEKEVVLTLIDQNLTDKVLTTITNDVKLNVPGHGIAFVLSVDEVIGLNPVREK